MMLVLSSIRRNMAILKVSKKYEDLCDLIKYAILKYHKKKNDDVLFRDMTMFSKDKQNYSITISYYITKYKI